MSYTREEFTKSFYPVASGVAAGTGIFPETILSAAILESSKPVDGVYMVGASQLSEKYNNYFGIKAGNDWSGGTVSMKTGEYTPAGSPYYVNDAFRAYPSVQDSFNDYISFLKSNSRYRDAGVFNAANPYEQFARLKAAGYATDPNYASLLTSIYNSIKNYIPSSGGVALVVLVAAGVTLFFLTKNKIKK